MDRNELTQNLNSRQADIVFGGDSILGIAIGLYDAGYTPIPLVNGTKKPYADFEYTEWQQNRPGRDLVASWFNGHRGNIGIMMGRVSKNLVIVDFDAISLWARFETTTYPELTDTLRVRTPEGMHDYYFVDDLPEHSYNVAGKDGIDIKCTGYCVVPPSQVNGHTYYVINNAPIKHIKTLDYLALDRFEKRQQETTPTPKKNNGGCGRRDTLLHKQIDAIKAVLTIPDAFPNDYSFTYGELSKPRSGKQYITLHCPSPDHVGGDRHKSGQYFYKDEHYFCNATHCRFNAKHQFDVLDVYRRLNGLTLNDAVDDLLTFYGIEVEE